MTTASQDPFKQANSQQTNNGNMNGNMYSLNINLPDKKFQALYSFHKYRAYNNTMYIKVYGDSGISMICKYKDLIKLKDRTIISKTSGFESIFIHSYESKESNGNGSFPRSKSIRQYARLRYNSDKPSKLMLIQKNFDLTVYNNEGAKGEQLIEEFGILMTFPQFNEIVEKVESVSLELESISMSQTPVTNDIDD